MNTLQGVASGGTGDCGWLWQGSERTARTLSNSVAPRRFFSPRSELAPFVEFGFVFPDYTRRRPGCWRRPPTGRASLFFAHAVNAAGGPALSGLFCEGPQEEGFNASHQLGGAVGVKLRVGALRALIGIPARELRNERVPLEALWGSDALELADRMATAPSAVERLWMLEQAVKCRLQTHGNRNQVAVRIAELIEQSKGALRVRELSDLCGLSQRTLLNKFDEWAGLSPKQYARLVRLRACMARLDAPCGNWATLAAESGFYDQSHMIHEFHDLLGATPTTFMQHRTAYRAVAACAVGRRSVPTPEQRLYRTLGFVSEWV